MRLAQFILCIVAMSSTNLVMGQSLEDYQWKNRILLLVDKKSNTEALTSQLAILTADEKALTERNLVIFMVTPDMAYTVEGTKTGMNPKKIYKGCDLNPEFTGIVLLGKDGGVKMREPFEVATENIFALIDGMPMRRREIRNSKGK